MCEKYFFIFASFFFRHVCFTSRHGNFTVFYVFFFLSFLLRNSLVCAFFVSAAKLFSAAHFSFSATHSFGFCDAFVAFFREFFFVFLEEVCLRCFFFEILNIIVMVDIRPTSVYQHKRPTNHNNPMLFTKIRMQCLGVLLGTFSVCLGNITLPLGISILDFGHFWNHRVGRIRIVQSGYSTLIKSLGHIWSDSSLLLWPGPVFSGQPYEAQQAPPLRPSLL